MLELFSVVRTSRATVGESTRASGRASAGALPSCGAKSMRTPCASSVSCKRAAANAGGLSEITSRSASAESDAPISRETRYPEDRAATAVERGLVADDPAGHASDPVLGDESGEQVREAPHGSGSDPPTPSGTGRLGRCGPAVARHRPGRPSRAGSLGRVAAARWQP